MVYSHNQKEEFEKAKRTMVSFYDIQTGRDIISVMDAAHFVQIYRSKVMGGGAQEICLFDSFSYMIDFSQARQM